MQVNPYVDRDKRLVINLELAILYSFVLSAGAWQRKEGGEPTKGTNNF